MDITLSGHTNLQHFIDVAANMTEQMEEAKVNERTEWANKVTNYRRWVTQFLRLKDVTLALSVQKIIEDHHIIILTGMNLGTRSAIALVDVVASNGKKYNVILVDQRYDLLPDEDKFLYWQRYILHEIGHIAAKHSGSTLEGWSAQKINMLQMEKKPASEGTCSEEEEAEFLRVALKLGNGEDFVRRVTATGYRLDRIAYENNIEVDCCAKYFIIYQPDQDWHYIKYNVPNKGIEDYWVPYSYEKDRNSIFHSAIAERLFLCSDRAVLGRLIQANAGNVFSPVMQGSTRFNDYLTCYCYAFFRPKTNGLSEDDKIICIGHRHTMA